MKVISLENIDIEFDFENNLKFYSRQERFTCECPECINYVEKQTLLKDLMNGLDDRLGIDLSKDVGQGMDELMPIESDYYVIPYYIDGRCKVNNEYLTEERNGPIWTKTTRLEYQLCESVNLLFINTTQDVEIQNADNILTMWIEFKIPSNKKSNDANKTIVPKLNIFSKIKSYFN